MSFAARDVPGLRPDPSAVDRSDGAAHPNADVGSRPVYAGLFGRGGLNRQPAIGAAVPLTRMPVSAPGVTSTSRRLGRPMSSPWWMVTRADGATSSRERRYAP